MQATTHMQAVVFCLSQLCLQSNTQHEQTQTHAHNAHIRPCLQDFVHASALLPSGLCLCVFPHTWGSSPGRCCQAQAAPGAAIHRGVFACVYRLGCTWMYVHACLCMFMYVWKCLCVIPHAWGGSTSQQNQTQTAHWFLMCVCLETVHAQLVASDPVVYSFSSPYPDWLMQGLRP